MTKLPALMFFACSDGTPTTYNFSPDQAPIRDSEAVSPLHQLTRKQKMTSDSFAHFSAEISRSSVTSGLPSRRIELNQVTIPERANAECSEISRARCSLRKPGNPSKMANGWKFFRSQNNFQPFVFVLSMNPKA